MVLRAPFDPGPERRFAEGFGDVLGQVAGGGSHTAGALEAALVPHEAAPESAPRFGQVRVHRVGVVVQVRAEAIEPDRNVLVRRPVLVAFVDRDVVDQEAEEDRVAARWASRMPPGQPPLVAAARGRAQDRRAKLRRKGVPEP
jgi:hypothetical protein